MLTFCLRLWLTCTVLLALFQMSSLTNLNRIAGTDTTSVSLSYFVWELSRRPDIIDRLRKELDNVMPDPKSIPDMSVLNSLPYLDAFIKEGSDFVFFSHTISY